MKFRNYCKRLEVEAKVYRAIGSDGAMMGSDGQRYRTMESDGRTAETRRNQRRCTKGCKNDAKGDVLRSKGVPLCRDGKEWQERQARAKGETTRAWKHTSESPKSDTL